MEGSNFRLMDHILNSTHDGIIAIDSDEKIIVFNKAAERLSGKMAAEVMGNRVSDAIPNTRLDKVLQTGIPEINQKQELGNAVVVTNRMPVTDPSGKPIGAVAVFRDITEIKCLAEEITNLREIQSLLYAVIESTQDAISVVDEGGNGILINPAYTKLTGFSEEAVIGRPATTDIAEGESVHLHVLKTKRPIVNATLKVGPMKRSVVVNAAPIMVDGELKGSVAVIRDVSEIMRLTEELENLKSVVKGFEPKYTFDDIITNSPLMVQAVEQAQRVSSTPVTVLLRGESGTGKELFAHAIHNASSRHSNPFVRVNCAALPHNLLESELFGYVDGAFTGAKKGGKKGLFHEADGGTLFFDEIGAMDVSVQASLLRVLQEREVVRIGESTPTPVDVRVIAATNAPLEQMVASGKFREDLYYRISVIPILIPPLRQRPEDIEVLCDYLVRRLSQSYGRFVEGVDEAVLGVFESYRWPGNVRELENVLSRAIINVKYHDRTIRVEHLPPLECEIDRPLEGMENEHMYGIDGPKTLQSAVRRAEIHAIARVLEQVSYNRTEAARILGVSVRTLYYKMQKYGFTDKRTFKS